MAKLKPEPLFQLISAGLLPLI